MYTMKGSGMQKQRLYGVKPLRLLYIKPDVMITDTTFELAKLFHWNTYLE